jgi:hypothetical protein
MALIACMILPGCGSAQEKAASKRIALFNELADRIAKIKTSADLTAAKPDLEAIGTKIKDLEAEVKQLPKPTADEQSAMDTKYKSDDDKAASRLQSELGRLTADVGPMAAVEVFTDLKLDPTDFAK